MKGLIFADLHEFNIDDMQLIQTINLNSFDIIILVGDINELILMKLSKSLFSNKPVIGVLGNHDLYGVLEKYNIINLNLVKIELNGIVFGGIEGSHKYKSGIFPSYKQNESVEFLDNLGYCDCIISHNSPIDIHEKDKDVHLGYHGLNIYIEKYNPVCVIHGHQHVNKMTELDNGTSVIGVYGVSILDFKNGSITNLII